MLKYREFKLRLESKSKTNSITDSYIDTKLGEIYDLVRNITIDKIIWEWKNNNDHQIRINYQYNNESIKWEIDLDRMTLLKVDNEKVKSIEVGSFDESIEMIEKDIQSLLNINESKINKYNIDLEDIFKRLELEYGITGVEDYISDFESEYPDINSPEDYLESFKNYIYSSRIKKQN